MQVSNNWHSANQVIELSINQSINLPYKASSESVYQQSVSQPSLVISSLYLSMTAFASLRCRCSAGEAASASFSRAVKGSTAYLMWDLNLTMSVLNWPPPFGVFAMGFIRINPTPHNIRSLYGISSYTVEVCLYWLSCSTVELCAEFLPSNTHAHTHTHTTHCCTYY